MVKPVAMPTDREIIAELQNKLFSTQFMLGCVEREYPGLVIQCRDRIMGRIAEQFDRANPLICDSRRWDNIDG